MRAALADAGRADAFRWSRPEALHLTLVFAGEIEPEARARLGAELADALHGAAPPSLRLGPVGAFPSRRRARVLWVGVEEPDGAGRLPALHARCLAAARAAGIGLPDGEHPFRPHVTLARARDGRGARRLPRGLWELAFDVAWTADRVRLFRSRLGPCGARHEELAAHLLEGT